MPRAEVLQLSLLGERDRETLLEFLSSSGLFQPSHAQFGYDGRSVAIEMELPRKLLMSMEGFKHLEATDNASIGGDHRLHFKSPAFFTSSTLKQRAEEPSQSLHLNGANRSTMEQIVPSPITSCRRSCQWLHKMMDDVFQFRVMQFRFESMAAYPSADHPTKHLSHHPRSSTPKAAVRGGNHTQRPPQRVATENAVTAGPGERVATYDDLSIAVYQMLSKKFGVPAMVKKHASDLLEAIKCYRTVDLDVQLFGVLLGSQAYDTWDLMQLTEWRMILLPYSLMIQETVDPFASTGAAGQGANVDSGRGSTAVQRRFVKAREVPALLRKCLMAKSEKIAPPLSSSNGNNCPVGDVLWQRVRAALPSWCDPYRRFPGLVPDPNFYCPPFRRTNPYVGQPPQQPDAHQNGVERHDLLVAYRQQLLAHEGAFTERFETHHVVHLSQVLMLLLMCWKEERLHPSPWFQAVAAAHQQQTPSRRQREARATSPLRRASPTVSQKLEPLLHQHQAPAIEGNGLQRENSSLAIPVSSDHTPRSATPKVERRRRLPQATMVLDMSPMSPPRAPSTSSPEHTIVTPSSVRLQHVDPSGSSLGDSPSLRDEEARFKRDLLALEQRLAAAIKRNKSSA